jgi:deoxyribodipyrimidine photo-lyase
MHSALNLFWFRRDFRLEDNRGLHEALKAGPGLLLFIFDQDILQPLPDDDPRVQFIHEQVARLHDQLEGRLLIKMGHPGEIFREIIEEFPIKNVYCNHDYEPYAIKRDDEIKNLLAKNDIDFYSYKDQVIFEKDEVVKNDGLPYTVFTPYKKKWLSHLTDDDLKPFPSASQLSKVWDHRFSLPELSKIGFRNNPIRVKPFRLDVVPSYENTRNLPSVRGTTELSPHLRFGTVSIRKLASLAMEQNEVFLSELIWREFYMQILYHFPHVVHQSFKKAYDKIPWVNNETQFEKWCEGKTGYPLVDAGMRELNATGYMHNRVRMVVASFLVKHLLIDWRWGEAYFAQKLLDFELSSNNGNWQWAAGSGCDAAPYFRVFNPSEQLKKFDPKLSYVKKWLNEEVGKYPPVVDHKAARERALSVYKEALQSA